MPTEKRLALVSGATGAIGKAIAIGLARQPNSEVVLVCRNRIKAQNTVAEIQQQSGNRHIRWLLADLSLQSSVKELAHNWQGPIHVLMNNAAITPRSRQETAEGIEMQWATNVLGYYWMIQYFSRILQESAPARIVNVASYWAGELDLHDPEFKRRRYDNNAAYRQSKQADRMLTAAFAEDFAGTGVTVNACHPGDVGSVLSNNLGFGGHESPRQGAATPVWLATAPEVAQISGKYFEHKQETRCRFSENSEAVESLFQICQAY